MDQGPWTSDLGRIVRQILAGDHCDFLGKLRFLRLDWTPRLFGLLSRGLPFRWATSMPSPFRTLPAFIIFARAAFLEARFFFCSGREW